MSKLIRCQQCGGKGVRWDDYTICRDCGRRALSGHSWWETHNAIRADKRFELVVAMAGSGEQVPIGVSLNDFAQCMMAAADAILNEMYGEIGGAHPAAAPGEE